MRYNYKCDIIYNRPRDLFLGIIRRSHIRETFWSLDVAETAYCVEGKL